MKLILKILLGLVVVVVAIFGVAIYSLDSIIKEAVVRVGPEVTGTNVALDDVNLSLLGGSASLGGLVIGNPDGFEEPNAFSLGLIEVELDNQTLMDDVIVIRKVVIDAPQIAYESSDAGDNFQKLLENIESNIGSSESSETDSASESSKKIIIEEFVFSNGSIKVKHSLLPGETLDVPMPDLTLTGIGEKTNGATVQEVSSQIIKQLTSAATTAVTKSALTQKLGEIKNKAKGAVNDVLEKINVDEEQKDKIKGLLKGFGK